MSRLTILEGPDGAGKTTLFNNMFQECIFVNHGSYDGVPVILPKYLKPMLEPKGDTAHTVFDRCWLSEKIYGNVYRNGNDRLGSAGVRMLERVALSVGAVVVLCQPEYWRCLEAFNSRRDLEMLDSEGQLWKVYVEYKELHFQTHLPLIEYDWTKNNAENHLLSRIEMLRPRPNEGPGIGNWDPGRVVLMVGKKPSRGDLVFVAGRGLRGGCSYWFASYLDKLCVPESKLYWINVQDRYGAVTDHEFVDRLRPVCTISLGKTAERWCTDYQVPNHVAIEHPMFRKRFHYGKPWSDLEDALGVLHDIS